MICKSCKIQMREMKRSYHKRRKWICPQCGRARMQRAKPKEGKRRR